MAKSDSDRSQTEPGPGRDDRMGGEENVRGGLRDDDVRSIANEDADEFDDSDDDMEDLEDEEDEDL
jgi:hypothetical protein